MAFSDARNKCLERMEIILMKMSAVGYFHAKGGSCGAWAAVYLPGQDDGGTEYAQSKGFSVLENINPGEGFWINATQQIAKDNL